MIGGLVIFHPDGSGAVFKVRRGPSVRRLQRIVGGHFELVPYWETFRTEDGKSCPARVFCNDKGKQQGLPVNEMATSVWYAEAGLMPDYLVGNIVVVFGSAAFLKEWDDSL